MKWRPKVVYDPGGGDVTINFELAQRPWAFAPQAIGGRRIAAGGAQATYKVRHDELVERRIRFTETEWPAIRTWLLWAQGPTSFDWYDDRDDALTIEEVYLHAPEMGQAVVPQRSSEFPLVFEMSITLRVVSGAASTRAYFDTTPF